MIRLTSRQHSLAPLHTHPLPFRSPSPPLCRVRLAGRALGVLFSLHRTRAA
jgi:hypothetical protein